MHLAQAVLLTTGDVRCNEQTALLRHMIRRVSEIFRGPVKFLCDRRHYVAAAGHGVR